MGREEEFARARRVRESRAFANDVTEGVVTALPRDRFGRPIHVGDLVLYRPAFDLVFEVQTITPVVDPRAPAGLATIGLACETPVQVPVAQPIVNLLVIGKRESVAGIERPGSGPVAPEPETLAEEPSPEGAGDGGTRPPELVEPSAP